jgi:glycerophosphoryl diester phosphodiesterase
MPRKKVHRSGGGEEKSAPPLLPSCEKLEWKQGVSPPRVIAHRGACRDAIENTLAAFRAARAAGAHGVELDVMRCASGEVVVFHDDDLTRLARRSERVDALPLDALREVDLGGGEGIPTLEEALEEIGPRLLVNVELKTDKWRGDPELATRVAELLRRGGWGRRALVSSFNPMALWQFQRAAPEVPTGFLFHAQERRPLREAWPARLLAPFALHPEASLVDAIALAAWRRRGFAVAVWTVDDPHEIAALAALGVDAIITNEPARALGALE